MFGVKLSRWSLTTLVNVALSFTSEDLMTKAFLLFFARAAFNDNFNFCSTKKNFFELPKPHLQSARPAWHNDNTVVACSALSFIISHSRCLFSEALKACDSGWPGNIKKKIADTARFYWSRLCHNLGDFIDTQPRLKATEDLRSPREWKARQLINSLIHFLELNFPLQHQTHSRRHVIM